MDLVAMLNDLGFGDTKDIVSGLGEEKILSLTREMLELVKPYIDTTVFEAYYGINGESRTAEDIARHTVPQLSPKQVYAILKRTRTLLRFETRIQILAKAVKAMEQSPQ